MESLKRMHLQDVNLTSEQAIALVEVLPEVQSLAHINILGNTELAKLAGAKTEEAQEEACALYASLLAAARISSSLVCVDIEVPGEESGEIVKAMAKQVVAYCLRNMERMPDTDIRAAVASAMTDAHADGVEKSAAYNDVLAHLVGHDVLLGEGAEDEGDSAPDEDYVIGGTGVVKALACCLKNKGDDSRRASGEFSLDGNDVRTLPTAAKAKDMSKHLLAGARKIRLRLQPALAKARADPDDEMNLRKLVFLDETLQGIIKRFEDEFPDTREPADEERKESSSSGEAEKPQVPPGLPSEDSAIVVSDGEDESEIHPPKALSRSNSMLSRELAEEEGRVHRVGHRFRSGFVVQENSDLIRIIDDIAADPKHSRMLQNLAEDIGGEMLERVHAEGTVTAFKDKDLVYRSMRDSDPEHWGRFIDSQRKARANISLDDESAIAD